MRNSTSVSIALRAILALVVLGLIAPAPVHSQTPETVLESPGKSQAEQRLLRRLVEIAEGPPPTKEALEAEFGLVFHKAPSFSESLQDYYATGEFPFSPGRAGGYLYIPEAVRPASIHVSLELITKDGAVRPFCIPRAELKALLSASWRFQVMTVPPHNDHLEGYEKKSGGYARGASMSPAWPAPCITGFTVVYEKST